MRGKLADMGAFINARSSNKHAPKVERYNRTVKELIRSQYSALSFKYVPAIFIIELVYTQVFWRNMFAIRGGVSSTQSPAEIILNHKLDFNARHKIKFGEYVQTHEEHDADTTTPSCTVGAIVTHPTGNSQGGYYFICLGTDVAAKHKHDDTRYRLEFAVLADYVYSIYCGGASDASPYICGEADGRFARRLVSAPANPLHLSSLCTAPAHDQLPWSPEDPL